MTTLVGRLEKLENDLKLLSAMQHLIVSSHGNLNSVSNVDHGNLNSVSNVDDSDSDIPTRDTPMNNIRKVPIKGNQKIKLIPPISSFQKQNGGNSLTKNGNSNVQKQKTLSTDSLSVQNFSEMEQKLAKLESNLVPNHNLEKLKNEDYEKDLTSQLQKKVEELERERECKNGLLRFTLQLKNQIQEKKDWANNLENKIEYLKVEKIRTFQDIENLKIKIETLESNFHELFENHNKLIQENEFLKQDLKQLELEKKEIQQEYELKEESVAKKEEKYINQLNQLVSKCAQIDHLRQKTLAEKKQLNDKLNEKDAVVHQLEAHLRKLESEQERSIVFQECELNRHQLELESQTEIVNQKIASCHNVLTQTKDIFLKLNSEKHELERCLSFEINSKEILKTKLLECFQKLKDSDKTRHIKSQSLKSMITEKEESIGRIKHKYQEYHRMNLKLKLDNEQFLKHVKESDDKFLIEVKRFKEYKSHNEEEAASLKMDLKNVKDNLSILQKISEDQIRSIQKLKSEIEEYCKIEFHLKNQLGDTEDVLEGSKEEIKTLSNRLIETEEHILFLEEKLSRMEDDLKKHNCDNFVDSTYKRKLCKLKNEVERRYTEWEGSIEDMRAEREKALTAAKRAVNKAIEMKSNYETQILEIQSRMQEEASRGTTESRREVLQKSQQIQNLEAELEKSRQDAYQSQRLLLQKIQQLQTALNICVGTFAQPLQQQPPSSQAFYNDAGNIQF